MKTTESNSIVGVIPKAGVAGLVPANLSFGMYVNDKDLKTSVSVPWLILYRFYDKSCWRWFSKCALDYWTIQNITNIKTSIHCKCMILHVTLLTNTIEMYLYNSCFHQIKENYYKCPKYDLSFFYMWHHNTVEGPPTGFGVIALLSSYKFQSPLPLTPHAKGVRDMRKNYCFSWEMHAFRELQSFRYTKTQILLRHKYCIPGNYSDGKI